MKVATFNPNSHNYNRTKANPSNQPTNPMNMSNISQQSKSKDNIHTLQNNRELFLNQFFD